MKRLFALSLCAAALLVNACEKHPASQLPGEHATQFGAHASGHGAGNGHEAKPAAEHGTAAQHEKPAAAPEGKPGEAPKFFPEKK